jgi:hypothetical protein
VPIATDLIPHAILNQIKDRSSFERALSRYAEMDDNALLYATEVCLRNLERVDDCIVSPDRDLRLLLVPELWERIRPGTRDKLRRLSTTLAEYIPPDPKRPAFFKAMLSAESRTRLQEGADALRQSLKYVVRLDVPSLVEQVRFAIARSRAADRWGPDGCVYEPGFTYRLVPAIVWRALGRNQSPAADATDALSGPAADATGALLSHVADSPGALSSPAVDTTRAPGALSSPTVDATGTLSDPATDATGAPS